MAAPGLVSVIPAEHLSPITLDQVTEQPRVRQASSMEADKPGYGSSVAALGAGGSASHLFPSVVLCHLAQKGGLVLPPHS